MLLDVELQREKAELDDQLLGDGCLLGAGKLWRVGSFEVDVRDAVLSGESGQKVLLLKKALGEENLAEPAGCPLLFVQSGL